MNNRIEYWRVDHHPDLTETGCRTQRTYIKTIWVGFESQQAYVKDIIEDYCYKTWGDKVAYVQGVAPTLNWIVIESTENDFVSAPPIRRGDYLGKTEQLILKIGDHGKIESLPYVTVDPEYATYLRLKEKFANADGWYGVIENVRVEIINGAPAIILSSATQNE
jgi:hypothetical protein